MLQIISHTSEISYGKWPLGLVAVPHHQQRRRRVDCSFCSPCWSHTATLPAGASCKVSWAALLSLLWLGLSFLSLWHIHTQQLPVAWGPGILRSLLLHAGLLRCCLLPAIGSDLSRSIWKDSAAVASMACMHSPCLMISFHPFKPPFKTHLVASAWVFLSFWEILAEGFIFYLFFYYEVSENVLVHFKYIWIIAKNKMKKSGLCSAK